MTALKIHTPVSFSFVKFTDVSFKKIACHLGDVVPLYPNFKEWLYFKFKPEARLGLRSVLIAHADDQVLGLSLLKKTPAESKICTFYVVPGFRGMGVASKLMERSISLVGDLGATITVSEERNSELFPTLSKFGFELSSSVQDMYRVGRKENIYNIC
jgi:GNAT superfamily N-acetyltransferase